jgi:hypothetical protein
MVRKRERGEERGECFDESQHREHELFPQLDSMMKRWHPKISSKFLSFLLLLLSFFLSLSLSLSLNDF